MTSQTTDHRLAHRRKHASSVWPPRCHSGSLLLVRPGAKLNLSISPGGHAHNRPELPQVGHVPGGRVTVGDDYIDEAEAPNPPHQVTLAAVWMGIFPVTNSEYAVYAKATGAPLPAAWQDPRFAAPAQPVVTVSWEDALGYCSWAGGRLPSEAEWEWSARGPDRRRYPWGDSASSEQVAHLAQDWNLGGTSPVGSHPMGQGPFGHQDLAGNVWEWCMDAWVKDARFHRVYHHRIPAMHSRWGASLRACPATLA